MKSVHKEHVNVYHHLFRMETFALNHNQSVTRIPNALLVMFVNLVFVPLVVDMIIIALKMMLVSMVFVRILVCWPTLVDQTHFVHHFNIDQGASVQKITWEIHTLSANQFRMITVQLMLLVHLEKFVNLTDVLLDAEMTCTASLMNLAFINNARIRVQSMALVDQMPFVSQSIMIDNVHAYQTLPVMPKLTAKEFDLHRNVQLINNVHLVLSARMKLASKDVGTQKIVLQSKHVSSSNVSMLVLHQVLVVLEQHVLLPIILPSATVLLDSGETRTSNVVKSLLNAELTMNVD